MTGSRLQADRAGRPDAGGRPSPVLVLPRRPVGTPRPRVIRGVRRVGTVLARAALRLEVTGAERVPQDGPVLLAGNHSGLLDGPLVFLLSPRPAALLAKSEVFVPALARALGWLGVIPVHRGTADRAALQAGLRHLRAGGALGVFPEGSRGAGTFEQTADGLAYLALRSGAPVVPIAVHGTSDAWPSGRVLPRWRAPVRLAYGAPVHLQVAGDPRARSTVRGASEQLREQLVEHLRRSA